MTRSSRLQGNVLPVFRLTNVGTAPSALDPSDDIISVNLTDGDGPEAITFSDFADGLKPQAFEVEATYSGDTGSLFDVLWKNAGRTAVGFTWSPHGVAVATAGKPVWAGTLTFPSRPNLESSASETDYQTFSVTLQITSVTRTTV